MSDLSSQATEPLILELLQKAEILHAKDIQKVIDLQAKHNESLEESLVRSELVTETQIAQTYAAYMMLPIWAPPETPLQEENLAALINLLPEKICRENNIAPVEKTGDQLVVATVNPTDMVVIEGIQLIAGLRVESRVARISQVHAVLNRYYGARDVARELAQEVAAESSRHPDGMAEAEEEAVFLDLEKPISDTSKEGQIVTLVNHILKEAIYRRASDIHLEPYEDSVRARLRIDGDLVELTPPPRPMFVPMVSRLKILSRMDIAEKRIPQDGAFSMQADGKKVDMRVNTVPCVWGEKMVMRLLNKSAIPLEMSKLGFSEKQATDFNNAVNRPHGLVFVTGPTGSGKSTTLYTALNMINTPDRNLVTVEDPVEYRFTGINQVQVKVQVDLTFASALRAFLRQDPDVIMVGEVRDRETAEICLRAALTGHLVLSTLHTNDAVSAVNRLVDMGVEPFLLAATLQLLQAQRLIRRLCQKCRRKIELTDELAQKVGIKKEEVVYGPNNVECANCGGQGYRGRVGLFEVIPITRRIRDQIQASASLKDIYNTVHEEGIETLLDCGVGHVRAGRTSMEEVLTVALEGDD